MSICLFSLECGWLPFTLVLLEFRAHCVLLRFRFVEQ